MECGGTLAAVALNLTLSLVLFIGYSVDVELHLVAGFLLYICTA